MRLLSILSLALVGACNGGGPEEGPFTLSLVIPASYSIHDGSDFTLAVLDSEAVVMDEFTGVIGTDTGAEFLLVTGSGYNLHFWVDSNIGGGTDGACDGSPDFFDHQWSYAIGTLAADRDFPIPAHNTDFQDVCSSFD